MITNRIVALAVGCLLLLPAAGRAQDKAVVFPFDLVDQKQQSQMWGVEQDIDPEQKKRLALLTDELTKLVKESGRYEVVDRSSIDEEIEENTPIHDCNGCEDGLAKKVGADVAFVGVVTKATGVLYTVSVFLRDVSKERVVKQGASVVFGDADETWLGAVRNLVHKRLLAEGTAQ